MAKPPRTRGSMPDVSLQDREPDRELLECGELGPYTKHGRVFRFNDVHPVLQEILVRMDKEEVANLAAGLSILTRLEQKDFTRLKTVLKLIGIFYGIGKVIKWSVVSFSAGLAGVVLAGDQLQKVWGWILNGWKLWRP